mmetsp:Transcript_16950/g.47181  ORF Transcript_16950/g.47181 Transcript_16950/m.47181 type:complete len:138 (+) Transcript_16950:61-474(+)
MGCAHACSARGPMAACLPRRAPGPAATPRSKDAQPRDARSSAAPPGGGAKGSGEPPMASGAKGAPVLLPISARRSGKQEGADGGVDLPRAALHGDRDSASPALSPSTARSRKSDRRVTFGKEEVQQFETVGKLRSIR